MAKIIFNRNDCIGCGSCGAICPMFWEMAHDGKTDLVGSIKNSEEKFELKISEAERSANQEVADICPLQLIEIVEE